VAERPITSRQWLEHAVELHGKALESVDRLTALGDLPAQVAAAHAAMIQALFHGAASAAAIGALRKAVAERAGPPAP
jgi:hypothetical protein